MGIPPGLELEGGSGLARMPKRLEALNGWLWLSSQPGEGTTMTAAVPLAVARR